ncbi:hypothetical protein HRM2_07440 [Desulforapulum autotrophicum HRM2]|uniref:Uncharacterized protein n=1 Tax=Desulforapulum autotrophicum (strain ATCC 43914 / DSM 3382 / VKM B-1955 / HRM2) TaxID=177437 RepID=C0QJK5_DESAH|nr:hypothetical protein [Desulforapulum autotrophicum]ACN13858.1 hypothetical protein HRM2_07440 [Desulforapulum autotrophicum HRM2]
MENIKSTKALYTAQESYYFILSRRLGYYRRLSDMDDELTHGFVDKQVQKIKQSDPESFETVFHNLRRQII